MKAVEIRPARMEDAAGIAKVQVDSWRAAYPGAHAGSRTRCARRVGAVTEVEWVSRGRRGLDSRGGAGGRGRWVLLRAPDPRRGGRRGGRGACSSAGFSGQGITSTLDRAWWELSPGGCRGRGVLEAEGLFDGRTRQRGGTSLPRLLRRGCARVRWSARGACSYGHRSTEPSNRRQETHEGVVTTCNRFPSVTSTTSRVSSRS
jgi:hypothetical protein